MISVIQRALLCDAFCTEKGIVRSERYDVVKKMAVRFLYYCLGMVLLAAGISLTTKLGLGVSPIISVPYCISTLLNWNFGNVTLAVYCLFVVAVFLLKWNNAKIYDALQIVVAIVFTRFLNLFAELMTFTIDTWWLKIVLLLASIVLTGIGIAMTVDMRLIPNPGDGIVQAISDRIHKNMGFTKNCFDLGCITCSIIMGLMFEGHLIGIGIGTVLCVIGVGRVVYFFNRLFQKKMCEQAGV